MKKLLVLFGCIALAFTLTACSDDKPDTQEEVLEASIQTAENINSYRSNIKINQEAVYSSPFKQTAEITMDYVKEPQGMVLNAKTGIDNVKVEGELYFVDGDVYQRDTVIDYWVEGKETGFHPSLDDAIKQLSLTKRLEWLQTHADDLEMEVKEGKYILTLTGSGDTYQELSKQIWDMSMPAFYKSNFGKNLKNKKFSYTVHIAQEDFLLLESFTEADLELTVDDDEKQLKTLVTIEEEISKVDEIDPIVVPDKVSGSAVDNQTGEKAN
ncbi:DUF6612 family protein [Rossellomorea aquimaris]|uniref:DUF6612 family protein n=1 Tax=Bacillaceae TaxID=186817 RepID=UPI0011ECFCBB|nr:DUF6612 family protein [Bacillus sp. CH30_1T]KAA0565808.1 hypothetical protein F0342_03710 [Bacillus sp. CH30_1T]